MNATKPKPSSAGKRTPPRTLQVVRTQQITPSMQRVTLGGDELDGFPIESNGSHIKVFFPRPGQHRPVLPTLGPKGPVWPPPEQKPIVRTYTARRYDPESGELDIDFVRHGETGSASKWAIHAKPGDYVGIAGPGGPSLFLKGADWFLLAGDLSALPAIGATLEALPRDATGLAFIEIPDAEDEQKLDAPKGVEIHWLYQGKNHKRKSSLLENAIREIQCPKGIVSATIAGESSSVVSIRDYLRKEVGLDRKALYAVPYWRSGQDEETYHAERHRIMDEVV